MNKWNFADVWETVAEAVPDRIAQIHGDRRISWRETSCRADGVASALIGAGLSRQDKVALYLYNAPEYMESAFACQKVSLVPVNTNYRYGVEELDYLWTDADVVAAVFHGAFTERVAELRQRTDRRIWIHVDDGTEPCPEWAVPYEHAASGDPVPRPPTRSGDDLLLIYTGGTTGRPKGVMWRQHDLYRVSDTMHDPDEMDLAVVSARLEAAGAGPTGVSAAPLMHGTGYVFSGTIFSRGGTLVHQQSRRFDAVELLDTIDQHQITALCIVGEAFGRPLVDALDAEPTRWDLSRLAAVSSAGMVWRAKSKQRLLRHAPNAILVDLLNSSEASGMGRSVTSTRRDGATGSFRLGPNTLVLDDDGNPVTPGSGVIGRLAVRGNLPMGYYKDPAKTAQVFPVVDGVRYSFPGDYATIEGDGTVRLLGRGSGVVNIGGEKVYPEEVEETLRGDPAVFDTIVVGVPDDRLGEVVGCVLQFAEGADPDVSAIMTRARTKLASYKVPRQVVVVEAVPRAPSGKPDLVRVKELLGDSAISG
jgi:acyl-CoA synthetase (AMP-forming)/AMP-acid ligase II